MLKAVAILRPSTVQPRLSSFQIAHPELIAADEFNKTARLPTRGLILVEQRQSIAVENIKKLVPRNLLEIFIRFLKVNPENPARFMVSTRGGLRDTSGAAAPLFDPILYGVVISCLLRR